MDGRPLGWVLSLQKTLPQRHLWDLRSDACSDLIDHPVYTVQYRQGSPYSTIQTEWSIYSAGGLCSTVHMYYWAMQIAKTAQICPYY